MACMTKFTVIFLIRSLTMKNCIATITSLNLSIRAQRALSQVGIYSRIVSLDPSVTPKGCAYGIEFPCSEEGTVRALLRKERIHPQKFISDTQGMPL